MSELEVLVELQELDTRIGQLSYRSDNLPEHEQLMTLKGEDATLQSAIELLLVDLEVLRKDQQDREDEIPMEKRSLHRIASQTKALTSAAVMILQERGQLLINDELGKYFPEWRETMVAVESSDRAEGYNIVPAKRSITIRDLLTHTAGVNYGWGLAQREWEESSIIGWYFAGDEESMRSKVRRMASLPHAAHPGEAFVYGYNTDILGALVEEISGQTLGAFLDANIFSPLGMKDTYFFVPGDKAKQLSTVYALTEDGLRRAPSKDQVETEPNGSNTLFYYGQGHYLENSISGNRS